MLSIAANKTKGVKKAIFGRMHALHHIAVLGLKHCLMSRRTVKLLAVIRTTAVSPLINISQYSLILLLLVVYRLLSWFDDEKDTLRYTAATLTDLDLSFSYIGYSGAEVRGDDYCIYIY